jgi:hypothetical protein
MRLYHVKTSTHVLLRLVNDGMIFKDRLLSVLGTCLLFTEG